jgi:ribonuclease D
MSLSKPLKHSPLKSEILEMESFDGISMESVRVVTNSREAEMALAELRAEKWVGFDTESKPTFNKGQKSDGPHVFQFSTIKRAFVFLTHHEATLPTLMTLLGEKSLVKVGFDLRGDLHQIFARFQIRPEPVLDLGRSFRELGYRNTIGATAAVAMIFKRRMHKSKSITTSNWAARNLTERQLLYAANDAYAAIRVFHALEGFAASIRDESDAS